MEIRVLNDINPTEFDAHAAHPLQSYAWGEVRKRTHCEVVWVGMYDGNHLKQTFQMTVHSVPHTPYKILYIPRSQMPSAEMLAFVNTFARGKKIIFASWEPIDDPITPFSFFKNQIRNAASPMLPPWTQIINLKRTEAELLAACDSHARYNIRYAERKGVEIREMNTEEGFEIFWEIYLATCARQKYQGHGKAHHRAIWEEMRKTSINHILVAWYENTPIAAIELFAFGKKLYYPYGGSLDIHRNVKAMNLLIWHAMLLGQQLGLESLDLWGSMPPIHDKNHPWAGFTEFKRSFGGEFVKIGANFDQVFLPVPYFFYRIAFCLRKLVNKLFS